MLHLVECMEEFGPTSAFNSERYNVMLCSCQCLKCSILGVKLSTRTFEHRIYMAIKVPQAVIFATILLPLNS